jgi:transcription antitermination factor NusG
VEEVAMEASEQARATQSGRWRIFVQAVVNALERAHQKAIVPQPVATKPPETVPAIPKTLPTLPVLVSSPKPSLPKIHPGDRVEIVRTQFRGFRGIVEAVKGDEVEIVLDGRTPMRIKLPSDAIKKLR